MFPDGPLEKRYAVTDLRSGSPAGVETRTLSAVRADGLVSSASRWIGEDGEVVEERASDLERGTDGSVRVVAVSTTEEEASGAGGGDADGGIRVRMSEPMVLAPGSLARDAVFEQSLGMERVDAGDEGRVVGEGEAVRRTRLLTAEEVDEVFGAIASGPDGWIGVVSEMDTRFSPARDARTEWKLIDARGEFGILAERRDRTLRVFGIATARESVLFVLEGLGGDASAD